VCVFSLVDLQIGDRLYYPASTIDYAVRTAFVHSISVTGVPPANPFFQPGHAVPLRYHYFWLMMCSLANQAGGAAISARQATIGGTFWIGAGLMALLAIYLRLFQTQAGSPFRRRAFTGLLLLAITGLDMIPTLFFLLLYARGAVPFVMPSVEWWNEQVDGFTYSALWEAHHLSGMIACMMAFLLLQEGRRQESLVRRATYAGITGIAVATAAGASIHVTFVFGSFLLIWTMIVLAKRWWREAAFLAAAGAVVEIYCTGLGAVTNQPGTGDAAPGAPYSLTRTTPTVKIGGVAAVLQYSGLAPGYVGLYQVNAQVPMSVSPGNAVPVTIIVETSTSNTVTIAVQ